MRIDAPPLQHHRLTRLHRWAMLWLKWLVGFLDGAALAQLVARRAPRGLTRRRAIPPRAFLAAPLAFAGERPAVPVGAAPPAPHTDTS